MNTISEIAERTNSSIEVIAKEMGKEMNNAQKVTIRDNVAIIPVSGPLFRYANLLTMICGATSYEVLAKDFHRALAEPTIKAIVLEIDSPGGEVNGCSELADMIYQARGQKPIIAYASGACCSGAYWIASACDKIKAADTAILGSIGVVSVYRKEDDKKSIEIVSSQSPHKRLDPESDEGRVKIQARIDDLAEVFINKISRNRGVSCEDVVTKFGGGDVFVGTNAVRSGLADSLSSFEEVITDLNHIKENIMNEQEIVSRERERTFQVLAQAKGKEDLAQALLSKTDLSSEEIVEILGKTATTTENAFEQAMGKVKNPDILPASDSPQTVEAVAMRVVNSLKGI
ncbi:MAG: S49 family peptidase [Alphaproteobacteria bacterium]